MFMLWAVVQGVIFVTVIDKPEAQKALLQWAKTNVVIQATFWATIFFIMLLIFTWRAKRRLQRRVWDFKNTVSDFMDKFADGFDKRPPNDFASVKAVAEVVWQKLVSQAKDVLRAQITKGEAEWERYQMELLSHSANKMGVGEGWETYFTEARGVLDLYECFDPVI